MTGATARFGTALLGTALVIFAITGLAAWRLAVPKAWEPILSPVFGDEHVDARLARSALFGPATLQATRSSDVAAPCRLLDQCTRSSGIAELGIWRLLECDERVHRAGLPQLGEFERIIKKAIRTSEWNVWVLRDHICDQEPRVVVPL
jgi:hypothetical protein